MLRKAISLYQTTAFPLGSYKSQIANRKAKQVQGRRRGNRSRLLIFSKQRMTQVLLYLFNQQKPWFESRCRTLFGFQDGNGGYAWQDQSLSVFAKAF
jgi:hypothetical protein